eukprot:12195333-Prorocentrum_lima.AAC.1
MSVPRRLFFCGNMFDVAMSGYSWQRQHPMHMIKPMASVPPAVKDFDNIFSFMLLKSHAREDEGKSVRRD